MTSIVLCALAFAVTYWAGKRSLGLSVVSLLACGYFYGILRANLLGFSYFLFDAALWDEWGRLEDSIRSGAPARTPDMFQSSPAATARDTYLDEKGEADADHRVVAGLGEVLQALDLVRVGLVVLRLDVAAGGQ